MLIKETNPTIHCNKETYSLQLPKLYSLLNGNATLLIIKLNNVESMLIFLKYLVYIMKKSLQRTVRWMGNTIRSVKPVTQFP